MNFIMEILCKKSSDASLNGKWTAIGSAMIREIRPNKYTAEGKPDWVAKDLELTIYMTDGTTYTVEKESAFLVRAKCNILQQTSELLASLGYQK